MANANIFGMVGQGVRSPLDYAGDFQRLQAGQQAAEANKLALMLQQQKMDEYGRSLESANKLRGITSGFGTDDAANVQALYQGGFLGEAQDYAKNVAGRTKDRAAAEKDAADTAAKQYDTQRKKFEHRIQGLSQFQDAQGAKQWLADSVLSGALSMEEAQQMVAKLPTDPAAFSQWRDAAVMSLMDAGKQAGFMRPDANAQLSAQTSVGNARLADERIRSEGAAQRAVQMRGQNISRDAALQGGSVQIGADGSMMVVPNKFVPGQPVQASPVMGADGKPMQGNKGAGGQPTEDERKSAGYAIRMEDALQTIAKIEQTNKGATRPGIGTAALNMLPEGVANFARGEDRQRVEAAQLDALDAALTLATGAAYTKEQLKGLSRSYFAQPGDKESTVAEKNARLQKVIETARVRAGRAATSIDQISKPAATNIDSLLDKYK